MGSCAFLSNLLDAGPSGQFVIDDRAHLAKSFRMNNKNRQFDCANDHLLRLCAKAFSGIGYLLSATDT